MLQNVVLLEQFKFYRVLFSDDVATDLVELYGIVLGGGGAACALTLGLAADFLGTFRTLALVDALALVFAVAVALPSYACQIVAIAVVTVLQGTFWMLIPLLCTHYAPPDLFGTLSGVCFALFGILQVVLTPLQSALTDCVRDAVNSAAAAQLSALTLWSSLSVASGWLLYRLLRVYPLPIPGSISMTEIRLAQESQAPLQPKGRSKGTSHQPYVSSVTM